MLLSSILSSRVVRHSDPEPKITPTLLERLFVHSDVCPKCADALRNPKLALELCEKGKAIMRGPAKFHFSLDKLHEDESGQGLIEYSLIIALVAFAAVVGMNTLATDINQAFSLIGSVLNTDIP